MTTDVTLQNPIVTAVQAVKSGSDVVPVSSSNPLPTASPMATSGNLEVIAGRVHLLRASQAAVAAQYARIQIHNPNSYDVFVINLLTFAGTAGTHVYTAYEVGAISGTLLTTTDVNLKLGGAASGVVFYGSNSATVPQTTSLLAGSSHTAIINQGTSIMFSGANIVIPAGKVVEVAISTVNVALNLNVLLYVLNQE